MYSEFANELLNRLSSCWLLWSKEWSSLLKDSTSNIDCGLHSELVSLCQWFLSTEAPDHFKNGANQALKLISSGTSLATHMSIDHQASDHSLERLLDSKNELLIQQACCTIAFLCWCYCCNYVKYLSFLDGVVVEKLFNLVEQYSPYSSHLLHARRAICSIAWVDDCVKKKIIIKAEHDTRLKWPFLFGDEVEAERACMIAACIFWGNKDDDTWGHDTIVDAFIPPIVDVMEKAGESGDIPLRVAAAYAIASVADVATPEQIDKLFALGCLRVLCYSLNVPSPPLATHILDGIDDILGSGHVRGNKKYTEWIADHDDKSPCMVAYKNKYEDWIDYGDDDRRCPGYGWVVFRNVGDGFPDIPHYIKTILQYKAYLTAFRYAKCMWIFDLMEDNP